MFWGGRFLGFSLTAGASGLVLLRIAGGGPPARASPRFFFFSRLVFSAFCFLF